MGRSIARLKHPDLTSILTDPDAVRSLGRDRSAYWDDESGTVVIHDPNHEEHLARGKAVAAREMILA